MTEGGLIYHTRPCFLEFRQSLSSSSLSILKLNHTLSVVLFSIDSLYLFLCWSYCRNSKINYPQLLNKNIFVRQCQNLINVPIVKTKRQANFKDFKRFGAFIKGLDEQKNVVFNLFLSVGLFWHLWAFKTLVSLAF
jgi:hypothetical protein